MGKSNHPRLRNPVRKFKGNVVLIGYMGTGKSVTARAMAKLFGLDIIEMDETIEEREGMSISEIFRTRGEAYFRELETSLLVEMQELNNVVVSAGGGTPLRQCNVDEMKKIGTVVLLTASPEVVLERVSRNNNRPLLEGNKNIDFITGMLDERRDKYMAAADVVIDTDGKNKFDVAKEINEILAER